MAGQDRKNCVHQFVATGRKGVLVVESFSLNKRGKPQLQDVPTTVFECSKCGGRQEYPDSWEKNFRMPTGAAAARKAAPARAKAKAKVKKKPVSSA